jgi:2-aminoadipate transaminase
VKHVFARAGNSVAGISVGPEGIDVEQLAHSLAANRPKLLIVTPNFQNPTGATLSLEARTAVLEVARQFNVLVAENDIYRELRYRGDDLPTIKQMDGSAGTVLIRSFSKIAFPGLRVGWMIGSKRLIAELTEARQWCDLHTDQLSQAVLLRFAQSGRLGAHLDRVRNAGAQRLDAVLSACKRHLPPRAAFTRPQGGMSLWVSLPEPLDAAELLPRAQRENVTYLPGKLFAVSNYDPGTFRLSFGGLTPDQIETGVAKLGRIFTEELARLRTSRDTEAASALV